MVVNLLVDANGKNERSLSYSGTKVASSEKDPKGSPLLEVDGGVVRVRSLRIASKLMRAAGSLKSKLELRACLEGGRKFEC